MDQAIKQQWIEALRSGKYEQGTGALKTNDGYCCLGMLCDLKDPNGWTNLPLFDSDIFDGEYGYLPLSVRVWADLDDNSSNVWINDEHGSLASMNDAGLSFHVIADVIETHL